MGQFSGSSSPHAGSRCLISFHYSSTRLQRTKKPSLSWLPCDALDFRFSGAKRVPCSREPRVRIALPPLSPTAPLEHGTSTPPRRRARRHRRSPGRRARRRSQRRELGSRAAVDWGSARRSCRSPARRGRVIARGGAEHGWSKPSPRCPRPRRWRRGRRRSHPRPRPSRCSSPGTSRSWPRPRRRPGQAPLSPAPPASPSDLIRSASATGSHGSRLCCGRRRPPRGPERGRRTRPPWARRGHPHTGRAVVDLELRVSGGLPAPALRCARTAGERGGQPTSESVRSGWRERDTEGLHGAEVLLRRPRGGWLVAMHVFDEMTHRREQGKDGW